MLLTIYNLPSRAQYKDVKELLLAKCGLSQMILDRLDKHGSGKSVMVGVASHGDAALIKRNIDGLYYEGQLLYVQSVGEPSKEPEKAYQTTPQSWSQSNQSHPGYTTSKYPTDNSYQSLSAIANLYAQKQQTAQSQFTPFGSQTQTRPPEPVPSPYGQRGQYTQPFSQTGQYNDYTQQSNQTNQYNQPRQPNTQPWSKSDAYSYSGGAMNRSQEPPYPGGPRGDGRGDGGGDSQTSRNFRDDPKKEGGGAAGFERREMPSLSYDKNSSRWNNPNIQGGRQFDESGRDISRNWKDPRLSQNQQKGPTGNNEFPKNNPWEPNQFQRNAGVSGPSTQHPPQMRNNYSNPPQKFEPQGRPVTKGDYSQKRSWEEANQQFQADTVDFDRKAQPPRSEDTYKWKRPNQQFESGTSTSQRPSMGQPPRGQPPRGQPSWAQPSWAQPLLGQPVRGQPPRGQRPVNHPPMNSGKSDRPMKPSKWNWEGRKFNKFITEGVAGILLENYKMVKDNPELHPTNPTIRGMYKRKITDRAYEILADGRYDLSKKEVMKLYRTKYTLYDDIQLYNDVVNTIYNVKSVADVNAVLKPQEEIEMQSAFTLRRRKKEKKKQLKLKDALIGMVYNAPKANQPPKPLIPPHPNNDVKLMKQQKRESKAEMKSLEPYKMEPIIEKVLDEEIETLAGLLQNAYNNPGTEQRRAIYDNVSDSVECIDHCKKFFKHHLSKRITNQGSILVRVYGQPIKLLKRPLLENFLLDKGCTTLAKTKSKTPFFIATFNSYKAADKVVALDRCTLGEPGNECIVEFRYMYVVKKPKLRFGVVKETRKAIKNSLIDRGVHVSLLDKDWQQKELENKKKFNAHTQSLQCVGNENEENSTAETNIINENVSTDQNIKDENSPTADKNIKTENSSTVDNIMNEKMLADTIVNENVSGTNTDVKNGNNSTADKNIKNENVSTIATNVKNANNSTDKNIKDVNVSTDNKDIKDNNVSTTATNVKNENNSTNKKDVNTPTADKNIKEENKPKNDTNVKKNTTVVTSKDEKQQQNNSVQVQKSNEEQFWSDDLKANEVKDSEDDSLPQRSLHTDDYAADWDETGDDWDESGEGWDDKDHTGTTGGDKTQVDLDDIDEDDLEDY